MRSGGLSWCLALAVVFTVPGCGSWDGVRTEVIDGVNRLVHRDYPRALQEARSRKLPLFIEAWAPWCHSCRSMRAFVFTSRDLAPQAQRFVWLEINTDDERNASLQDKLQIDGVPTFFVVDPSDEHVALRHLGSTTVDGLQRLLDDGARAVAGSSTGLGEGLARTDALFGAGKHAEAAKAYAAEVESGAFPAAEHSFDA